MLLIIDKSLKNSRTVSDLFYLMGVICNAIAAEDAIKEISNRYRAVIISNPETIGPAEELITAINTYSLGAPIFALCKNPEKFKFDNRSYSSKFDDIFGFDMNSSEIFNRITNYQSEHKLSLLGDYKLSGIDASVFRRKVSFFDTELPFTKTEIMILRFLIRSYPSYAAAKDILKFSFRQSKTPEIQSIRTHISIINKKFKTITDRNLIISEPKSGYTILTPEMAKNIF